MGEEEFRRDDRGGKKVRACTPPLREPVRERRRTFLPSRFSTLQTESRAIPKSVIFTTCRGEEYWRLILVDDLEADPRQNSLHP
jgi:hypothetical protein